MKIKDGCNLKYKTCESNNGVCVNLCLFVFVYMCVSVCETCIDIVKLDVKNFYFLLEMIYYYITNTIEQKKRSFFLDFRHE